MAMVRRASAIAIVVVLCLALEGCEGRGGGHPGYTYHGPETIFNVMAYGAKPGQSVQAEDNTDAFQKTWGAACEFDGPAAKFSVPPGEFVVGVIIFGGPCKSQHITVEILGTLLADSDPSNYEENGWLVFDTVDGLTVGGGGTLNARGESMWKYNDCKSNSNCKLLPATIYMNNVRNLKLYRLNLLNSMGFHMHITTSFNVRIHAMRITAPADSPNTDGLHISKSTAVKIARSTIATGDDCISIGHGCNNVTLNRLTCGPGHGISVGSLGKYINEKDVTGLIVKNCTLIGTTNGVRIKTMRGPNPSKAVGFLFSNIVMKDVHHPIIIDQVYGKKNSGQSSSVRISNIIYQNIVGTATSPDAVSLVCSPEFPCENVRLHNIDLKTTGNKVATTVCSNIVPTFSGLQNPPPCK